MSVRIKCACKCKSNTHVSNSRASLVQYRVELKIMAAAGTSGFSVRVDRYLWIVVRFIPGQVHDLHYTPKTDPC